MKKGREKAQSLESRTCPDMSLAQALEILDEYSHSIEPLIRNRLEEERKKQEEVFLSSILKRSHQSDD